LAKPQRRRALPRLYFVPSPRETTELSGSIEAIAPAAVDPVSRAVSIAGLVARNDLTVKQGRAEKRKWRRKGLKRLIQRPEMAKLHLPYPTT
jgi:hypothetical protein